MSEGAYLELQAIDRALNDANVGRVDEGMGRPKLLSSTERIALLVASRDEARKLAEQTARELASLRQTTQPADENVVCTGLTARWCPQCGDCTCDPDPADLDKPSCPLHGSISEHAEQPDVYDVARAQLDPMLDGLLAELRGADDERFGSARIRGTLHAFGVALQDTRRRLLALEKRVSGESK